MTKIGPKEAQRRALQVALAEKRRKAPLRRRTEKALQRVPLVDLEIPPPTPENIAVGLRLLAVNRLGSKRRMARLRAKVKERGDGEK